MIVQPEQQKLQPIIRQQQTSMPTQATVTSIRIKYIDTYILLVSVNSLFI
jgi:hypothetical protein